MHGFYQPAYVFTIPVDILHIIHNGLYQANSQPTFTLFVDQITDVRGMKFVDIENGAVINNLKNDLAVSCMNVQFNRMIGITVMCVNHEIGAHFIHCQYNSAYLHIGQTLPLQRLPDEVADALKIT